MNVVTTADPNEWADRLADAGLQVGFWGRQPWIRCCADIFSATAKYLLVMDGDSVVCGMPIVERNRWGLRKSFTPPFSVYGDIALHQRAVSDPKVWSDVATALATLGADAAYSRWAMPPDIVDVRPWQEAGWTAVVRYTRRVPTTDEGQLWSGISRAARKQIRKAERSGVTINTTHDVTPLVETMVATSQMKGLALPCPQQHMRNAFETLLADANVELTVATHQGKPAAAVMTGADELLGYDLWAGTGVAGRELGAASLLRWEVLRSLVGTVEQFEFNGANIPSVAQFKKGFGGTKVVYHQVEHTASWTLKLAAVFR